jgi:ribosome-binding factor A
MKPFPRTRRIAELIQHELATIILRDFSNPIFQQITITGVEVNPDYSMAKIFIRVFDEAKSELALEILRNNAKELRHALAKNLNLRTTPRLNFLYDTSISYGQKLDELIKNAIDSDMKKKTESIVQPKDND